MLNVNADGFFVPHTVDALTHTQHTTHDTKTTTPKKNYPNISILTNKRLLNGLELQPIL